MGITSSHETPNNAQGWFTGHNSFFIVPTKEHAVDLLMNAESYDNYLEEIADSTMNTLARRNNMYVPANTTIQMAISLESRLKELLPQIPPMILNELSQTKVVCMMLSADGGMPHTRPRDLICMTYPMSKPSISTLVHELWHLHQRKYIAKWQQIFKNAWHFKPYDDYIPEYLENARRLNPDTIDQPYWIWRDKWIPICIFINPTQPSLGETEVWYYNPHSRIHRRTPPDEFTAFFSNKLPRAAYEHPRELAAYILTHGDISPAECPAYERLIAEMGSREQIHIRGEDA